MVICAKNTEMWVLARLAGRFKPFSLRGSHTLQNGEGEQCEQVTCPSRGPLLAAGGLAGTGSLTELTEGRADRYAKASWPRPHIY